MDKFVENFLTQRIQDYRHRAIQACDMRDKAFSLFVRLIDINADLDTCRAAFAWLEHSPHLTIDKIIEYVTD